MPTVLREGEFGFIIYVYDHEPMHIHARHQGRQAVVNFQTDVTVQENNGLNRGELRQALGIVRRHQTFLQNC